MNNPNACNAKFYNCHCMLPKHEENTPHECVPDPVCGGSWVRHTEDEPGMVRVYRWPSNRPECEAYSLTRNVGVNDPEPGEYILIKDV